MTTTSTPPDDSYDCLGLDYMLMQALSPERADDMVRRAYRRLAAYYSPDNPAKTGNVGWFYAVNAAYKALKTAADREAYDRGCARADLEDGVAVEDDADAEETYGPDGPTLPKLSLRARIQMSDELPFMGLNLRVDSWKLHEGERVVAWGTVVLLAVFTALGIWQWPLPITLASFVIKVIHAVAVMPVWVWLLLVLVVIALVIIPHTSAVTIAALIKTGKGLAVVGLLTYIWAKMALMLAWRAGCTTRALYKWARAQQTIPGP